MILISVDTGSVAEIAGLYRHNAAKSMHRLLQLLMNCFIVSFYECKYKIGVHSCLKTNGLCYLLWS